MNIVYFIVLPSFASFTSFAGSILDLHGICLIILFYYVDYCTSVLECFKLMGFETFQYHCDVDKIESCEV